DAVLSGLEVEDVDVVTLVVEVDDAAAVGGEADTGGADLADVPLTHWLDLPAGDGDDVDSAEVLDGEEAAVGGGFQDGSGGARSGEVEGSHGASQRGGMHARSSYGDFWPVGIVRAVDLAEFIDALRLGRGRADEGFVLAEDLPRAGDLIRDREGP